MAMRDAGMSQIYGGFGDDFLDANHDMLNFLVEHTLGQKRRAKKDGADCPVCMGDEKVGKKEMNVFNDLENIRVFMTEHKVAKRRWKEIIDFMVAYESLPQLATAKKWEKVREVMERFDEIFKDYNTKETDKILTFFNKHKKSTINGFFKPKDEIIELLDFFQENKGVYGEKAMISIMDNMFHLLAQFKANEAMNMLKGMGGIDNLKVIMKLYVDLCKEKNKKDVVSFFKKIATMDKKGNNEFVRAMTGWMEMMEINEMQENGHRVLRFRVDEQLNQIK